MINIDWKRSIIGIILVGLVYGFQYITGWTILTWICVFYGALEIFDMIYGRYSYGTSPSVKIK